MVRSRAAWWIVGALVAVAAIAVAVVVTRSPDGPPRLAMPPPLPGEPPLTREHERVLRQYTVNLAAKSYPPSEVLVLACRAEASQKTVADAETRAFTRRFVALLRSAPGVSGLPCPPPP